mgnify:FL=1|tara:strand:- start:102 stop:779 length:678 start_codon:yes stop_codon:yes gene_type:complete
MKKVAFTLMTFIMVLFNASANEIYIKQISGTNSSVTITQSGSGNTIGDSAGTVPTFDLDGNSQTINITQGGSSNSLVGYIKGATSQSTINLTGSSNTQSVFIDATSSDFEYDVVGSSNTMTFNAGDITQIDNLDFDADILGDSNTFDIDIKGDDIVVDIDIDGDSNDLTVDQAAFTTGVTSGHSVALALAGDFNDIEIFQESVVNQNILTLDINGSFGTWSITQQ